MAFETINLGTQPAGTGGDTARSAFEKTNRNFLAADVLSAAMSQAQFEAIRAHNNEEFAASGFVHFGKHHNNGTDVISINEGAYSYSGVPNIFYLGRDSSTTNRSGKSKTDYPICNIAGVVFNLINLNVNLGNSPSSVQVKYPKAPDGKTTYNKLTGVTTTHATTTAAFNAQAVEPTNIEVVIERVDMWGFEAWLEEVNTTNPYVYPNGLIQSQAANMDGVTTSSSARPVTYYAVFDGDTGSKGKGLNFFALNDAQKKKVLANHKNNLYYLDDGRLVQWRLRQRTFAGAGNGDWGELSSVGVGVCLFSDKNRLAAQGHKDIGSAFTTGTNTDYVQSSSTINQFKQIGVLTSINGVGVNSINGECYFLVCGTVNCLNQGAYHPGFNPSGTAVVVISSGSRGKWHDVSSLVSTVSCFNFGNFTDVGKVYGGSISLGAYWSGRPDGRFYDAIYADGKGGICRDMRYSAHGIDSADRAETDQRVKNSTYRGFEKTKLTTALSSVDSNMSVGGNFLVTEVIATNAVINATAALSGGWSGFKNAQSPTGSISVFELSRDAITAPTALRSTNNGSSWSVFTPTYNAVNNSVTLTNEPAANIVILQYQAFATQTEIAANAAIYGLVPYNVFASSDYRPENGALLGESLIGKVLKNNSGVLVNNKSLSSCAIDGTGKLTSATNFDGVTHQALTLGSPVNNSPAFKAVSYLANINQQAVPHFAYTELKHNGTNWGDDGKVTIVDNQATKTDLNGNTVLVGTAKLKEPIGWIKNKV
ncbi:hypothetical protein [Shewanella mangrovisoli]|uniref:hypothetical protein n=1 Tax=Shewanella mangrovisoli TaxID=2864211 RepID=UPI00370B85CD